MESQQRQELIAAAVEARERAYAPYSQFRVGAAVLTATGRIYRGCNVENASYGLTICAERVAITAAVAEGETAFEALCVVTTGGATPCGACRQFAAEFAPGLPIILIDADRPDIATDCNLAELLPGQFKFQKP